MSKKLWMMPPFLMSISLFARIKTDDMHEIESFDTIVSHIVTYIKGITFINLSYIEQLKIIPNTKNKIISDIINDDNSQTRERPTKRAKLSIGILETISTISSSICERVLKKQRTS